MWKYNSRGNWNHNYNTFLSGKFTQLLIDQHVYGKSTTVLNILLFMFELMVIREINNIPGPGTIVKI